jgi:hypothetical protein
MSGVGRVLGFIRKQARIRRDAKNATLAESSVQSFANPLYRDQVRCEIELFTRALEPNAKKLGAASKSGV